MTFQLQELEVGFVKQIEKHWNKWHVIFQEFETAARKGYKEMITKQKQDLAGYEEYLEKTMPTDFRPTHQLKDLKIAEEIMSAKAE